MTLPVPDGMGPPIPDDDGTWGSGMIDIYVLGEDECVTRGDECVGLNEANAAAATRSASPFGVPGRPEASSGFLRLSRGRLGSPRILADLAHEFFHVLQFAHHAHGDYWYDEATATWAEWVYTRADTRADVYAAFRKFQRNNRSLLESPGSHQYHSWVWPLFQADHAGMGAPSVFSTWESFESLTTLRELDAAVDESLPFESFYRDFAVTNLQPRSYRPGSSTGLEAVTWQQLDDDRRDFPRNPHVLTHAGVGLRQGSRPTVTTRYRAGIVALAAQSDEFVVADPKIRQITIDVSSLTNGDNVDLDIVGRLDEPGSHWSRIAVEDDDLTLCRDDPSEDFDLFYVVISNHSFGRRGNGPSPTQKVAGRYSITTERNCDVPVAYEGTFSGTSDFSYSVNSWNGTARFELTSTSRDCDIPSEPPSRRSLRFCYRFAGGQATWTADSWEDQSGCSWVPVGPVSVNLPPLDPPRLFIARRDPDPDFVNFFYILVPGDEADATMVVTKTCPDYTQQEEFTFSEMGGNWISTPGFNYIGGDWALHGSPVLDHQSWTFDLQPIFDED
jgi:hypothetical protein